MPNRIVRPGILTSDRVDALSPEAEVFYRRLMSKADDYGRFDGDWRVLRAELYPLRSESTTQEQIEGRLAECTQLLAGEEEPLISQYFIGRKRYLCINNFGQPIRSQSKFPEPNGNGREKPLRASASNCEQLSTYARATETHSHSHPQPESHSQEGGAGGNQNGTAKTETAAADRPAAAGDSQTPPRFDERAAFDDFAAKYPKAGRVRLDAAFERFRGRLHAEFRARGQPLDEILAEMREGLERWLRSELWHAGKVHWIGKWFAERLWAEDPLAASEAPQSRAGPPSKREQGVADFRRRMHREMEEKQENAGLVHRTGSG